MGCRAHATPSEGPSGCALHLLSSPSVVAPESPFTWASGVWEPGSLFGSSVGLSSVLVSAGAFHASCAHIALAVPGVCRCNPAFRPVGPTGNALLHAAPPMLLLLKTFGKARGSSLNFQ